MLDNEEKQEMTCGKVKRLDKWQHWRNHTATHTDRTSKRLNQEAAHNPPPHPQTSPTDHGSTLHSSTHSRSAGTPSHPHSPQYQASVQAHQEQANTSAANSDNPWTSSSGRNQVKFPSGLSPQWSGQVGVHIYLGGCAWWSFDLVRRVFRRVRLGLGQWPFLGGWRRRGGDWRRRRGRRVLMRRGWIGRGCCARWSRATERRCWGGRSRCILLDSCLMLEEFYEKSDKKKTDKSIILAIFLLSLSSSVSPPVRSKWVRTLVCQWTPSSSMIT